LNYLLKFFKFNFPVLLRRSSTPIWRIRW